MIRILMACICPLILMGIIYGQDDLYFINNLEIEGNESISKNEILFIVRQRPPNFFFRRPKFDPRLLRLDALTLKNYYYSKGFLDVAINESYHIKDNSNKNKFVDILYKVVEGKQYHLSKVHINGNNLISKKKITKILGLKIDSPYNPVGLNDNLYLLENEYQNLGKLFATITVKDEIKDSVEIKIDIDEGKYIYIKNTRIEKKGNIDSAIVIRELNYESGDLFSKIKVDKSSKQLRELGIFSTANIYPEKSSISDTLVNMVIDLRRYKQREWNSSGGYDPISFAEGAPELSALSATIEWRNRAFFNTSKQFSTAIMAGIPFEVDFVAPRLRYDVSLSSNWFLGIRFPTKIVGYYERFIIYEEQKYQESIDRFGTDLTQRFRLKGRSYVETKSLWEYFADASEDNIQERSVSLKLNIDKKDDPLFTKKGLLFNGIIKSAGFGGSREYSKIDITLNTYYPLTKRSVFAMRIQFGKIWGWDENYDDYSFEKFYLGGSTSMRGWEVLRFSENENNEPNGETIRLMTNIEIRQKIYKSFGMTVFSDGGLLAEVFPKEFYSELIWDSGIGITVDTPLGPARLDYAIQLNDFSKQKLQLGVQNLF
ncbi:MAG: BamA/TamA family outer membrane protein, partial [Candidatus Neomarinimicrobiota bacterium]